MAQMNISLPDKLKAWADARVAEGRYSSASDYIRDLMRRDQDEAQAKARLEADLLAGRESPLTATTIDDIIAARRG